ncbi:hypothetical protein SAMN05661080_05022 [Modestobacter sp. DSM 44400]|nr:hypothetical protein SAMN05661080_05022 [Modestobacter sp. DSM 44400]
MRGWIHGYDADPERTGTILTHRKGQCRTFVYPDESDPSDTASVGTGWKSRPGGPGGECSGPLSASPKRAPAPGEGRTGMHRTACHCHARVKPAGVVCDGYRVIFVSGQALSAGMVLV